MLLPAAAATLLLNDAARPILMPRHPYGRSRRLSISDARMY